MQYVAAVVADSNELEAGVGDVAGKEGVRGQQVLTFARCIREKPNGFQRALE